MDIHITPLKDLYIPTILEVVEIVKPRDLIDVRTQYRGSIDKFLEKKLRAKYGNTCTVQGLTDWNVKVKSRSIGTLNTTQFAGEIHYNLKIVVNVCIPPRGVYIKCRIINFNEAFLLARNGPLLIIARRPTDVELRINAQIIIEIQNYRNIIKDNTIKVMGKFIKLYGEEEAVIYDRTVGMVMAAPITQELATMELTKDDDLKHGEDTENDVVNHPPVETTGEVDSAADIVSAIDAEGGTDSEFVIANIPIGDKLPVVFYSRSKDTVPPRPISDMPPDFRKILSNFYVIAGGIAIEGKTYPSVEHWFQSQKYFYTDQPGKMKEFTDTQMSPKRAKEMGSKKFMRSRKITLDTKTWNRHRDQIMYKGILERYKGDPIFKKILDIVARENLWLVHYDRSASSYWGGKKSRKTGEWVGTNALGQIMMNIIQSPHLDAVAADAADATDVAVAADATDVAVAAVAADGGGFVPTVSMPDDLDNIKVGGEFTQSDIKVINIKGLNRLESFDDTSTHMENEYMENYSEMY